MTVVEAIRRLESLESRCYSGHAAAYYEDGEAIGLILKELKSAIYCSGCNGRGRRWYTGYGETVCDGCKGSGKRR